MSDEDPIKAMNEHLSRLMPGQMTGAVNLLAHPVAGAAAISALAFGMASQALGIWMGAWSSMSEATGRMSSPNDGAEPGQVTGKAGKTSDDRVRATARAMMEKAQGAAREAGARTARTRAGNGDRATSTASAQNAPASAMPSELMPEDFRQPKAMARPKKPDDLKAISGIGPKLEATLNGLGIWRLAQIASLSREEIAWLEDYLGLQGRIARDGWLAQASDMGSPKRRGQP